jgi:hypothetical protein
MIRNNKGQSRRDMIISIRDHIATYPNQIFHKPQLDYCQRIADYLQVCETYPTTKEPEGP